MNIKRYLDELHELFKPWIDHPKEGSGRRDLDYTDECWKKVLQDIYSFKNSDDKVENELAKHLLYTGEIRRVHLDIATVKYDNHYVSWTSAENLEDIYWLKPWLQNPSSKYTIITANATKDNPGISVNGFVEAKNKWGNESYTLNSPAIRKEQEVIFPLQKKSILSIKKIK